MPNSLCQFFSDDFLGEDKYDFVGWIPVVSGHLDFGFMEPGLEGDFGKRSNDIDNVYRKVNYARSGKADSHARNIVLESTVNWQDFKTSRKGNAQVIVLCETVCSDDLNRRYASGYIAIRDLGYTDSESAYNKLFGDFSSLISDEYESFQKKTDDERTRGWNENQLSLNDIFYDCIKRVKSGLIDDEVDKSGLYLCRFFINSDGLTYLKYLPQDNSRTNDFDNNAYGISRQSFYYLKYSLHSHKHHAYEQDALTTIEPVDDIYPKPTEFFSVDNGDVESPKRSYPLKLIGRLKREMVNIKRAETAERKISSSTTFFGNEVVGIAAYLKSLIVTLKKNNLISENDAQRELSWVANTVESFVTLQSKAEGVIEKKLKQKTNKLQWSALFLAVFSFSLLSWISANSGAIAKADLPDHPLIKFLHHPYGFLGTVFILYSGVIVYVHLQGILNAGGVKNIAHKNIYNYNKGLKKLRIAVIFIPTALLCITLEYFDDRFGMFGGGFSILYYFSAVFVLILISFFYYVLSRTKG